MLGKLTEQQVEIHDVTFLQQIFQSDIIILLQQVDIAVPGTSPAAPTCTTIRCMHPR